MNNKTNSNKNIQIIEYKIAELIKFQEITIKKINELLHKLNLGKLST